MSFRPDFEESSGKGPSTAPGHQADPVGLRASAFQWLLQESRDEIFLVARAQKRLTIEGLRSLAHEIANLVPSLRRSPFHAEFTPENAGRIVSLCERDSLSESLDELLEPRAELFDRLDLPPFRLTAVNRARPEEQEKDGEDGKEAVGLVALQASHAVAEGGDLVQLLRSRKFSRHDSSAPSIRPRFWQEIGIEAVALASVPVHLLLAHLLPARRREMSSHTVVLSRPEVERLSRSLGVRKRSLLYALITHSLIVPEDSRPLRRSVSAACIGLKAERSSLDDEFLQARARKIRIVSRRDFPTQVVTVDQAIERVERTDSRREQYFLNAVLRWHRRLARAMPALYRERFFRYRSRYDFVLSLLPPLHLSGPIGSQFAEPVFIGAWHQGENLCAIVYGPHQVTITMTLEERYSVRADRISEVFERESERFTANPGDWSIGSRH